jgi:hypothetical protein
MSRDRRTEEYMSFVKKMRERYPNLINLERHLPKFTDRKCRVREIYIPQSRQTEPEFTDAQDLRDHLSKRQPNVAGQCRVYVLENLDNDFMAVFGQHFNIDPTFFATHVRTTTWEGSPYGNNTPKLLRLRDPKRSFILRYSELRLFDQDIKGKKLFDSKGRGKYQESLRYIVTPSESDYLQQFWKVGLARRCVSLWSKENSIDCWDGIDCYASRNLIASFDSRRSSGEDRRLKQWIVPVRIRRLYALVRR